MKEHNAAECYSTFVCLGAAGDLGCREEMACAWYAQRQRQARLGKEKETKKRGRGTRTKLKIVNTPSPFHYANKMALEVPLTSECYTTLHHIESQTLVSI